MVSNSATAMPDPDPTPNTVVPNDEPINIDPIAEASRLLAEGVDKAA